MTSYLTSAARNFGADWMIGHDERYARAEEFLDVACKLWEGSWADDAVVADKRELRYARGDRVRPIAHEGAHYRVHGPHVCAPSPQRSPVLIQPAGRGGGANSRRSTRKWCSSRSRIRMRSAPASMKSGGWRSKTAGQRRM